MKHAFIFSVVIAVLLLGAGCASNVTSSKDGLFSGGGSAGGTISNQGTSLQSPSMMPTTISAGK